MGPPSPHVQPGASRPSRRMCRAGGRAGPVPPTSHPHPHPHARARQVPQGHRAAADQEVPSGFNSGTKGTGAWCSDREGPTQGSDGRHMDDGAADLHRGTELTRPEGGASPGTCPATLCSAQTTFLCD